ncbi:hypothetical protein D9M73_257990 [compost metagenome]
MVLDLQQRIVLAARFVLAVDLADDDLALAGNLLDREHGAEVVVRAALVPVAEGAVGLGLPQF